MSRSPDRHVSPTDAELASLIEPDPYGQQTIGKKTMVVGLAAMGALVAAAFAAFIVGQQRVDQLELEALAYRRSQQNIADLRTDAAYPASPPMMHTSPLAATGTGPIDLNAAAARPQPLSQASDQQHESPAELKARLDRMAASPAAREALNRTVLNTVRLDDTFVDTPDARLRATLEQAVDGSIAQGLGSVKAVQQVLVQPQNRATTPSAAATQAPLRAHSQALQVPMPPASSSASPQQQALSTALHEREAEMRVIEVRAGDTLWTIAKRAYGDPYQYQKIFAANPRLLASPNHIYPGQILRVPL